MNYFDLKTSKKIEKGASRNLKIDENYFSSIFETFACVLKNSDNGILVFRAVYSEKFEIIDFECVFSNAAAENIFSSNSSLAQKKMLQDFEQFKDGSFFELCKKVAIEGKTIDYEHCFTAGEMQRWFRSVIIKNGDGIVINISDITNQKQSKIELQYMIAINEIIAQISTKFINININEIDNEIKNSLNYFSEFLNVDFSYFFWMNSDSDYIKNIYSNAQGCALDFIKPFHNVEISKIPGIISAINDLSSNNFEEIGSKLQNSESIIEVNFFKSLKNIGNELFLVPVFYANKLSGFLILALSKGSKTLAKEIVSFSKVLGEIFANALVRKRSEEKLLRFNEELEKTVLKRTNELQTSLKEKEILLKEVHHRVKNNLQIITSMLKLQSSNIKNNEIANHFKIATGRIKTMALIHERLYHSSSISNINFLKYIKNLTNHIYNTFCEAVNEIEFDVNSVEAVLDVDSAISCGLIINELVTNSLKYAFKDKPQGKITINFKALKDCNESDLIDKNDLKSYKYLLNVSDNGTGFKEGFDINSSDTLGMQIVASLVEELKGKLEIMNSKKGLTFNILF